MDYQKIKRKNKIIVFLGLLFVLIGISVLIYDYYSYKKLDDIENISIDNFIEETITDDKEKSEDTSNQNETKEEIINYMAVLEIPKINLKKGIVDKNSSSNNVNRNVYILKESTLPDEAVNSHIILAAHSGNSYISYFRNLGKLSLNDEVYFYYSNQKYIYKIVDKYEVEKTGTINLKLTDSSDITLITCVSNTNRQVVYVGKLERGGLENE